MNKQQAQQLIQDTFETGFDRKRYIHFLRELLNSFDDEGAKVNQGARLPEKFQEHVEKIERIGKYTEEDTEIMLFVVYLKRETAIERARTMQRNFVAWYLSQGEKDAALVAYVSSNHDDWRFSLVKMDYKFEKTKTGKMKVKEEFTPARRWSFLVGENEKSHTAQSRLVKDLADDEHAPTLAKMEEAFNIETVTNEFFLKYRELFLLTKEALDNVVENDPQVRADFDAKGVDTVNFAKKLLGQIVFLYFLQKKGWFGVGRDDDWGTGSKHFLRGLFEKTHGDYTNFFNDILEPLFYEALRIDRSHDDDYYSRFNCKIPFLNGGLFDPIGNYDWVHTDIHLSNDLFSNSRKTHEGDIGDGIMDVFDRYNFTVWEDEPLEKEVAIDPELLGKAYEKFNAIRPDNFEEFTQAINSGKTGEENKFNKKFGVYYTPREIVHYMCKQSLINYLSTRADEAELSSAIQKQEIEDLIEVGEMITEHEATALIKEQNIKNGIQKSSEYTALLANSIRENAADIDKWLDEIMVCDPAAGSGAFPVGMMNEIVRARNVLSVFLKEDERSDYEFKRRCIEHSLYGVDIDPGAVEIAKLRLWLSLVVDEESVKNIKPLPNLDYKIICGNSLLGVEKDLFNHQLFNDLEKLKPLFFSETNPTKKQEYKKQIDDLISQITNGHKEFDFEVYLSEVFHEKKGFDVVIANPPYVRADSPGIKEQRQHIMQSKNYQTLYEKWDLYVAFIERSFQILTIGGVLEYIIPDAYMTSKYAIKSHDYFLEKATINRINFINEIKVFEAAVKNVIIEFTNKPNPQNIPLKIKHSPTFNDFRKLPSAPQEEMGELTFRVESEDISLGDLLNTLPWGEICYVSVGLVLQAEERLWKGEFIKSDLIADKKDKIHKKPYIEAKWTKPYFIKTVKYLEWDTDRVPQKIRRPTFPELYRPAKIMMGGMTSAIYDDSDLLCNHSIMVSVLWKDLRGVNNKSVSGSIKKYFKTQDVITFRNDLENKSENFDLKYLLSVLNSKVGKYYLSKVRRSQIGFYPDDLKKLPIKIISKAEQESFIALVDKIIVNTKSDDYLQNPQKQARVKELESEIDQLVYQLYGLTEEEIRIVEGEGK